MGAKGSKKSGGSPIPDSASVMVKMTAKVARTLLASLTAGNVPPQEASKAAALALVRALNTSVVAKKGKK
jgi:hypothetical protein